jgi:hypothetical protein
MKEYISTIIIAFYNDFTFIQYPPDY